MHKEGLGAGQGYQEGRQHHSCAGMARGDVLAALPPLQRGVRCEPWSGAVVTALGAAMLQLWGRWCALCSFASVLDSCCVLCS
jgi:hypothetical protein